MTAVLRTARSLLSAPFLIVFACAYALMWSMPSMPVLGVAGLLLIIGVAFLAMRIADVLDAGVWRLLPDGHRTLVRAIGLIVLATTLLPRGFDEHAVPDPLSGVPFGTQLANVVFYTLLTMLLLAGIGRRMRRLAVLVYLLCSYVSLHFLIVGFADSPTFWYVAAGICAVAWLYVAFGKLAASRIAIFSRHARDRAALPTLASTPIAMPFAGSPARALLRSRRGASAGLASAALVVVGWCAFQLTLFDLRAPGIDSFVYPGVLWVTVFLVMVVSHDVCAGARMLWLRWGDSRGAVFRLAERMLFFDAAVLCTLAWGTVSLVAWLRGMPIDASGAVRMLAAYLGASIAAIYVPLAFATFHAWWQQVICALLGVGAVSLLSFRWLDAFGASPWLFRRVDAELLFVLFLILFALRTFAAWRWKRIDWIHFRRIKTRR